MKHTRSSQRLPRTLRAAASLLSAVALIGMPGISPAATAQDAVTEAVIYDDGTDETGVEEVTTDSDDVVIVDEDAAEADAEADVPAVLINEDGEIVSPDEAGLEVATVDGEAAEAGADADAPKVRRARSLNFTPYGSYPLPSPSPNPELPKKCGLNIALVFDVSASLDQNEQRQSQQAATELVKALEGTDSTVGLFSFATEAYENGTGKTGTAGEVRDLERKIATIGRYYSNQNFYGGTNWQGAMEKVADAAESYDVVYFITDGRPTATNPDSAANPPYRFNGPTVNYESYRNSFPASTDTIAGGIDANYTDVKRGIEAANRLKEKGVRIQTIGVGMPPRIELLRDGYSTTLARQYIKWVAYTRGGVVNRSEAVYDTTTAEEMLSAISSPDAVRSIRSYSDLKAALTEAASELCNPAITVRKEIVDENGNFIERGADWTFSLSGRGARPEDNADKTTGRSGAVSWVTEKGEMVTVTETQKPGYTLRPQRGVNAKCYQNVTYPDGHVSRTPLTVRNEGRNGFQVQMPYSDKGAVVCTVQNKESIPDGGFAVRKNVIGSGKDLPEVRNLRYQMGYHCWAKDVLPGDFDRGIVKEGSLDNFANGTRQTVKDVPVGSTCWVYEKKFDTDELGDNVKTSVRYTGEGIKERPVAPERNRGVDKVAEFTVTEDTETIAVLVENRFDAADFHIKKLAADPIDDNPHYGKVVTVNDDGTAVMQYKIRVENLSDLPGNAGKVTDTFTVPAGLQWDGSKTATFEALSTPGGPRLSDIQELKRTATQADLASGFTVATGINNVPGRGTQDFLVTIPLKLDLTKTSNGTVYDEHAENLNECYSTTYRNEPYIKRGSGVVNSVALEGENKNATPIGNEDNQACVPIKVDPKWESSKQASDGKGGFAEAGGPGAEVTPDEDGNITALYRIKVTNTSNVAAPNTDVMETFTLPDGFELTKAEIAYNRKDTTPDDDSFYNLSTKVFADESGKARGIDLLLTEDHEKCRYINEPSLPVERAGEPVTWCRNTSRQQMTAAGDSFYYFIKVTAKLDSDVTDKKAVEANKAKAGECENAGTGTPGKGFFNFVSLPGEEEPEEDNDACVPVKFPKLEIKKAVHVEDDTTFFDEGEKGRPITVDRDGRFVTTFRITVANTGVIEAPIPTFTDTMTLPDGFTIEKVTVTENDEGTFVPGFTDKDATVVQPEGKTITFHSKKECESNRPGTGYCNETGTLPGESNRFYFVTVTARGALDKPEAWEKIGVCEGEKGNWNDGQGFVNAVSMPAYPGEPTNDNEVCVPVNKPGWEIRKAPASKDRTAPGGYGPDGGTGTTVTPADNGEVTVDYRIQVTNTGTAAQTLPEFTDTLTLPDGYELVNAKMANGTSRGLGGDPQWTEVVPKNGVVTITQDQDKCDEGLTDRYCGAKNVGKVEPKVSHYYFFRLVARPSADITPEQTANAGECQTDGAGTPGKGFFNLVDLPGETGGPDDNDACVPVEPGNGTIDVVKFNLDGNLKLPGAEFTVYKDKDGALDPSTAMVLAPKKVEGNAVTDEKETAENAMGFKSGDLQLDQVYWLKETRAPYSRDVDYELLPEPMRFKLTAQGISPWDGEKFLPAGGQQKSVLGKSFVITNTSVHVHDVRRGELPKAGGIGHWTLAGGAGMLILFSLVMAYRTPATRRTR